VTVIPLIGVMVGCYIAMRCFDVFCRAKESYASTGAHAVMWIVAALVLLVTAFCVLELVLGGRNLPRP
jgi:hypothetical protein